MSIAAAAVMYIVVCCRVMYAFMPLSKSSDGKCGLHLKSFEVIQFQLNCTSWSLVYFSKFLLNYVYYGLSLMKAHKFSHYV